MDAWATALACACDVPEGDAVQRLARAVHVLTYGAVFQALLTQGVRTDWAQVKVDLGRSLAGHLSPS